jgi:predicted RNA-binding protein with PIN domain
MHFLIDGHNLIAALPDISLEDPEDEAKLVLLLRSWTAAGARRQVTIVFDGGLPGGTARTLSSSVVRVIFASSGIPADNLLISRIRQVRNPAEYTLVSSDRAVTTVARARGMPHTTSQDFAQRLLRAPEQHDGPSVDEKPELAEEEIADWLKLFGDLQ